MPLYPQEREKTNNKKAGRRKEILLRLVIQDFGDEKESVTNTW